MCSVQHKGNVWLLLKFTSSHWPSSATIKCGTLLLLQHSKCENCIFCQGWDAKHSHHWSSACSHSCQHLTDTNISQQLDSCTPWSSPQLLSILVLALWVCSRNLLSCWGCSFLVTELSSWAQEGATPKTLLGGYLSSLPTHKWGWASKLTEHEAPAQHAWRAWTQQDPSDG